ncbi:CsbD family protein [Aquihabitans sp. McL0605]|uniref:CsbD family protein n=1 Tax=Aquihabitans sp. McL0605 TaxID=3415671 RepID=UPI003CF142B8
MDETKGRVKEAVGDLTNDPDKKREGQADRAGASVKEFAENAKDKVDDAVDKLKDKRD